MTTDRHPAPRRSFAASGEHWKRLLPKASTAERLTLDEAVEEANRRLSADPACQPGTRFVRLPPAAGGAPAGFTWQGPESMKPLVSRTVAGLLGDFVLDAPFHAER